ncbi:hypothetical protein EMCRGX_G029954, partial [Ephydatia muelleri]
STSILMSCVALLAFAIMSSLINRLSTHFKVSYKSLPKNTTIGASVWYLFKKGTSCMATLLKKCSLASIRGSSIDSVTTSKDLLPGCVTVSSLTAFTYILIHSFAVLAQ